MSAARDEVLARIRAARLTAPASPAALDDSPFRPAGGLGRDAVVARFVERVEELGVRVIFSDAPARDLAALLAGMRIAIPADLPLALRPEGVELVEDVGLDARALDELDGALTTCAGACAETGTLALGGGPGEGRRALSLVPDLHVCVVGAAQIVETVPELLDLVAPVPRAGRPLVLVSGPSATSDIELERVEGVHGPRRLVVLLVP